MESVVSEKKWWKKGMTADKFTKKNKSVKKIKTRK